MNPKHKFKIQPTTRLRARFFKGVFAQLLAIYAPLAVSSDAIGFQPQDFSAIEARLLKHPTLQQLKLRSTAMQAFAKADSALPDPIISLGLNNVPINTFAFDDFLPTHKSIGVQQSIPNSGIRRARLQNARTKSASLELAFEYEHSLLRASLIIGLIDQVNLEQEISLARQRDRKYSELQQVIRNEINAGRAMVFRLARIDIERADVAQEVANLQAQLTAVKAKIDSLIEMDTDIHPPPLPLTEWDGNPLSFHRVRLAMANISIAETRVSEVQAENGPSWGVSLTYQQRQAGTGQMGSPFSGDDWFSGQLTFTVPIWASKKQAPALRAAIAEKAAAKMDVASIAREVESEWRRFAAERKAANSNIVLLEKQLQALEEQIAASLTTYESGTGDYAPIVDGEITRLQFKSKISREKARRNMNTIKANSQLVLI